MKKNLVVCGCSFTHGHHLSTDETWGKYVATKQDWLFHNIACGGVGNEWITQKTIGYLENNPEIKSDCVVMIGWSETGRQMGIFQYSLDSPPTLVSIRPNDFINDGLKGHWTKDVTQYHGYTLTHGSTMFPFFSNYAYCFFKTYLAIFNLKTYLEYNNIPYVFFDALSDNKLISVEPLKDRIYKITYKTSFGKDESINEFLHDGCLDYLNKDFESKIFDQKYINFNGNSMLTEMRFTDYEFYTIGNSGHPNINACDYFSDFIINEYKKLYT